ncbi:MAG TPA: pilus assembly protein CpaE [Anaerolineae bacterium]|nr:pilus assembly protein CpaE [Anaerolineae bacterium]
MLSLTTAKALREAGLAWTPQNLDFFAIPMADFEGQVFAINDMTIMAEVLYGEPAITFHGSVEWALDHLWVGEVIWLPREEQLRELLEEQLLGEPQPALTLETSRYGYRCTVAWRSEVLTFEAFDAGEAYAAALLHTLLT